MVYKQLSHGWIDDLQESFYKTSVEALNKEDDDDDAAAANDNVDDDDQTQRTRICREKKNKN